MIGYWIDKSDQIGEQFSLQRDGRVLGVVYRDGNGVLWAELEVSPSRAAEDGDLLQRVKSADEGKEWVERRLVEMAVLQVPEWATAGGVRLKDKSDPG